MKGVFAGSLLFLLSCSSQVPSDILQVHLSSEPVSLDPSLAEDGVSLRVINNTMDGLVGYDGAGHFQKRLAESYEISPDKKKYTFKIRPDALWSDGKQIQVQDFITAIERSRSSATGSKLAGILVPIRKVSEQEGKLVIELKEPTTWFLEAMTLSVTMPLRADILAQNQNRWPRDEKAPSCGSYRMVSHKQDQEIVLEKNPWAPPSAPKKIILRIVQNESTAASIFEQGKLDILTRIPTFDLPRFKKRNWIHSDPLLATYFLSFNFKKHPFDNRDFRRAVAGAIHRDELMKALASDETPAKSWIPKGLTGYLPYQGQKEIIATFSDSMARVKAEVKKNPVPEFSAAFDSGDRNSMIMEKIQQDLLHELGLKISLVHSDWKSYVSSLHTDPAPLFRFGWLAPIHDPVFHLQAFLSQDSFNLFRYSNPEYDSLVHASNRLPNGPEREAKIMAAQKILVEREAIVVPIYHYVLNHAVSDRVQGFRVNPFGVIRFDEIVLKKLN